MKTLFVLFVPVIMLCAAEPPVRKAPRAVAARPAAAKRIEIPAGAVEFEPGAYRFTDTAGKKWVYRKTPFGIGRYEDAPEAARTAAHAPDYADVKAAAAGDFIRFERATPFGVSKWETRKSELDEMERAVWQREQTRSAQD
jgi:hypothetical protein